MSGAIVLAVDELNPVKLLLHVFPSIQVWHITSLSTAFIIYVCFSEFKELLYFAVKIFINSMLSIFFRDIEVIGKDKLPRHGPMIFVINHANQFVDAMVVLGTCGNEENFKVSYLMAEKSFHRPIIGDIASALDVVPVKRAQVRLLFSVALSSRIIRISSSQHELNARMLLFVDSVLSYSRKKLALELKRRHRH